MKNQMKNQMKNHPVVVGPKVLLVGRADRLGRLVDLPVNQAGHLGGLADLPVDQADHLEGAEDGEPRKVWIEPGKAWIEPRKAQRQRKSEHRKDKRVGNAVIHELPRSGLLGNPYSAQLYKHLVGRLIYPQELPMGLRPSTGCSGGG